MLRGVACGEGAGYAGASAVRVPVRGQGKALLLSVEPGDIAGIWPLALLLGKRK